MMNFSKKSWKTTAMGVTTILSAVSLAVKAVADDDPATVVNMEALLLALFAGIGLIFSRDNDKSSESVGAK